MKFALFVILLSIPYNTYSQSLDYEIHAVASDIAQKVVKKKKLRLAVADFVNNIGTSDAVTAYVTKQIESELLNSDYELELIDRKHIEQLLSDNKLRSQGLIDERTARSSTSFIKVDGWVLGEVIYFEDNIKITVKAIDVTTSLIFVSTTSALISDPAINKLKESIGEQEANIECQQMNTGDFCFTNGTSQTIRIGTMTAGYACCTENFLTIAPGENTCIYSVPAKAYKYDCLDGCMSQGQFKVIQCKTEEVVIRK